MADAAAKLEHTRRLLAQQGVPVEALDRLAVSPRVAARLLAVSPSMVEKLVGSGELPAFNVGRAVRIELVELVEFMERNRKVGRPAAPRSARARALALLDGEAA